MVSTEREKAAEGRKGLPGYPIDSIGTYKPISGRIPNALAALYLRKKALCVAAVSVWSIAAVAALAFNFALADIASSTETVARLKVPSVEPAKIVAAVTPVKDSVEKTAQRIELAAAVDHAVAAAGNDGNALALIKERSIAAETSINSGFANDFSKDIASIDAITTEFDARAHNETVIVAADADLHAPAPVVLDNTPHVLEALEKQIGTLEDLASDYDIRIVDGKNETSGFWRSSTTDKDQEQQFVIVEARRADGTSVTRKVKDMDTGIESEVSRWAVLVTPKEFTQLSSEKAMNGKIRDTQAGIKSAGSTEIVWKIDTKGEALTHWNEVSE